MRYLFTLLLFISCGCYHLFSQDQYPTAFNCTNTQKSEWLTAYQKGEFDHLKTLTDDTLKVGLSLHIVSYSDGRARGSLDNILNAFDILQRDFMEHNIIFFIEGEIDYINNSSFHVHNYAQGQNMIAQNNIANTINCYFVENPGNSCGYASFQNSAVVLANGCIAHPHRPYSLYRTWSHEMGHFLSLPHTYNGWETVEYVALPVNSPAPDSIGNIPVERVDGSNCSTAGDGFCDTPPDYRVTLWGCDEMGFSIDSLLDPDSIRFAQTAGNIMSAVSPECLNPVGQGGFSPEQATAMKTYIIQQDSLSDSLTCMGDINSNGLELLLPENGTSISPQGALSIDLSWTTVEHATHYLVEFAQNQFFIGILADTIVNNNSLTTTNLEENTRYYWRVRPINSFATVSEFSEAYNFSVEEVIPDDLPGFASPIGLTVSPNPAEPGMNNLQISTDGFLANEVASLTVVNNVGQQLINTAVYPEADGSLRKKLDISQLPAGLYYLQIQQNNRQITSRFMVGY